jgi:hypothetical protein
LAEQECEQRNGSNQSCRGMKQPKRQQSQERYASNDMELLVRRIQSGRTVVNFSRGSASETVVT